MAWWYPKTCFSNLRISVFYIYSSSDGGSFEFSADLSFVQQWSHCCSQLFFQIASRKESILEKVQIPDYSLPHSMEKYHLLLHANTLLCFGKSKDHVCAKCNKWLLYFITVKVLGDKELEFERLPWDYWAINI